MRPLLKLNPYFAKYRWHMVLGVLFIALSNLSPSMRLKWYARPST